MNEPTHHQIATYLTNYALSELAFIERLRNQREQAALPADKADEANKASQNKSNDDDAPT